jgi:hypothetical protein
MTLRVLIADDERLALARCSVVQATAPLVFPGGAP